MAPGSVDPVRYLLMIALVLGSAAAVGAEQVAFELDAPNGSAQTSTVLGTLQENTTFSLYITPLEQHLGESLYSTEIQVLFGGVGLAFARMDPRIINKDIEDPDSLPPIWETRRIIGEGAVAVEDPRVVALGSSGVSMEDDQPFLLQARYREGVLQVFHRPFKSQKAYLLAKYRVKAPVPVRTRVIGYKARFTLP